MEVVQELNLHYPDTVVGYKQDKQAGKDNQGFGLEHCMQHIDCKALVEIVEVEVKSVAESEAGVDIQH